MVKSKARLFLINFSYMLTSNLVSFIISSLIIFIIPKLIGIADYGYLQLYMFYVTYVGFLHFGWNDGIYLRYGGKEYKDLDKESFFSQFYMLVALQLLIAAILGSASIIYFSDENRIFIILMTIISMIFTNIRYFTLYVLLGTNRIREYSRVTIFDRIVYAFLLAVLLIAGVRNYQYFIIADLAGRLFSLIFSMYYCKEIVFNRLTKFTLGFKEAFDNIRVGIKLMFANIASMLIIGIVRFGIERNWDVLTFGKVSLTLSVSNLLMLFINAVGTIMFPVLRRTDENKLPGLYFVMRDFLMIVLFGVLIVFYPLRMFLSEWLPKYVESLTYMALVFPMCVYEGKMALLVNTYLKTLRKEKLMLKINVSSMLLSVVTSFVTILLLQNLYLAIASILMLLAIRCIMAEILLAKIMNINVVKDIFLEIAMTAVFVILGWFVDFKLGLAGYTIAYIVYLAIKKSDLKRTLHQMKLLMQNTAAV